MKKLLAIAIACAFGAGIVAHGATWHVGMLGNDENDGSASAPFATVAKAVQSATAGDTILVGSGQYAQFVIDKASLTIEGGFDTNTWTVAASGEPTVICDTANWSGYAVQFNEGAARDTLRRLTLTTIHPNDFSWSGARFGAACIETYFDSCVMSNCFWGVANYGTYAPQSMTFDNCLIVKNGDDGIHFQNGNIGGGTIGLLTVRNCTIADNKGDGILSNNGNVNDHNDVSALVQNTIFAFNRGAGYNKHGAYAPAAFTNCLFNGNQAGAIVWYCGVPTVANCSEGPVCFVDRANGDYRLAAGSAAGATGLDLSAAFGTDIAGNQRGVNGWDIGAYETDGTYTPALLSLAYVDAASGNDVSGDGSASAPFATLAYALARTATGGEIRVAQGTYYSDPLCFCFDKTNITVRGAYVVGTPDWTYSPATAETILDGRGGTTSSFAAGNTGCKLVSLTLTGATNPSVVSKNSSESAGVRFAGPNAVIEMEACRIIGNQQGFYGSANQKSQATLRNCVVARNAQYGVLFQTAGQVAYTPPVGPFTFLNCTVAYNGKSGFWNEGNSDWHEVPPIAKNTIFANNGEYGIAKRCATGGSSLESCLFYGNAAGSYLNVGNTKIEMIGGIQEDRDPLFADPANNDFSLLDKSPAATVGLDLSATPYLVTTDIRGLARPDNGWDLGAYECPVDGAPQIVYVDVAHVWGAGGSDTEGDGSAEKPFKTISYALAHTAAGGTILVTGGDYHTSLTFGSERCGITVRGCCDPVTWEFSPTTQLSMLLPTDYSSSVITIQQGSNSNSFESLVLACASSGQYSSGVYFDGSATGTMLDGCVIVLNKYGICGVGGIACDFTAKNCTIAQNSSYGTFFDSGCSGDQVFMNCAIADNGNSGYASNGNPDWGCPSPFFRNCVIARNQGYGIDKHGQGGTGGEVSHCYFFMNRDGSTRDYSNSNMAYLEGNDGGRDPLFNNPVNPYFDYSPRAGSPLIDAGADLTEYGVTNDILNIARAPGDGWDIGPYVSTATPESGVPTVAHVSPTGDDTTGDGSASAPYATLDKAVQSVAKGGLVKVAGGTYGPMHLGVGDSGKTIRGGYDALTWEWDPEDQASVVNGNGNDALAICTGADTVTVENLTLTGASWNGGVRFRGFFTGLVLDSCRITGNAYGVYADGTPEQYTETTLRNCVVSGNTNEGICYTFVGDWRFGRGIASICRAYNCTIADNGGNGMACSHPNTTNGDRDYCYPDIRNTIFSGNGKYAVYKTNVMWPDNSVWGISENCLFYDNGDDDFYAPGFINATNNIPGEAAVDPLFTSDDAANPYALGEGSPAINAGTASVAESGVNRDILGKPRPAMRRYDIGAYEFQCELGTLFILR